MGWAGELLRRRGAIAVVALLVAQLLGFAAQGAAAAQTDNVFAYGDATFFGSTASTALANAVVGVAPLPSAQGYWLVASDGGIFVYGAARFYGSAGSLHLNKAVVGIASTPDGGGYWLVGSDGGILSFGDAQFFGSTGSLRLNQPIVAMAPTRDGRGYWLVASDGGIFSFGDAMFFGSTAGFTLSKPIVGIAPTPSGNGYWLVGADGGVYAFGDAHYFGSAASAALPAPIVALAATHDGGGYWMVASNGDIYSFGDAVFYGSPKGPGLTQPVTAMAANPVDGLGYWIVSTGNYTPPPPPPPPPPPTPKGTITGSVQNGAGTALPNICVDATDTSVTAPGGGPSVTGTYRAFTSVTGSYQVGDLPASQYKVEFQDCNRTGYLPQWFNNEPSASQADPVSVSAGSTTGGVNANLVLGGSIAGTVTDSSSNPVSDLCVDAFDAAGASAPTQWTSVTGSYRVIGLPTGQYHVRFSECASSRGYVTQWYNAKPDQASSDPVSVTQGATTPNIDARLAGGPPPDTTPPTITSSLSPSPNAAGWNSSSVTLSWTVADDTAVSSTTGCGATTLSTDTPGTTYTCTATDTAGLTSSASRTIRLDRTPPSVSGTPSTPPNQYGWYQSPVTVRYTCYDALSGVAFCPPDTTLLREGANQSVTATGYDVAGNGAASTVSGINIDMTPPTITGSPTTKPNTDGWYSGPVTVAFTCTDAVSGIWWCPPPVTLSSQGANQSVGATAMDRAGNIGTTTVYGINIDMTPPTITGAPTTPPNGYGWWSGPVTVAFNCSDALSGVASCPSPVTVSSSGANQSVTGTAADKAGNTAAATVSGINIDTQPPSTTIDSTSVGVVTPALNTPVRGMARDDLSGVATVFVRFVNNTLQSTTLTTATVTCDPSGPPWTCSWSTDPPWQPGTYSVQAWAVDKAGNPDPNPASASITII